MIPTLSTERLILRGFREADLDAYATMSADPEVMRFIGADGKPRSRTEAWRGMATFMGEWALRGAGMWALEEKASGRFVGRAGIINFEGWPEPELGYALARNAWGKGYAREAGRAALDWAFAHMRRERLVSFIRADNLSSKRTAAALGGVFETNSELFGTPCEVWVYSRAPTAFA
jgi:RimJ/RimL family protein N-acetyltransferase